MPATGRSRQILPHRQVEDDGRQEEDFGTEVRGALGEEFGRSVITTGAVLAGEVEEGLVGGDGGEEVRGVAEGFQVEELGFDGGVAAFDVGVGVGASGRVEAVRGAGGGEGAVEAVGAVVDGVAVELAAEVGAHFEVGEVEAVLAQVRGDAGGGERGVGLREVGGVGEEERAGGFVADGILETGHAGLLHLRIVVGDVVEVFGVHLEAAEGRVRSFERAQVGFAPVLAGARLEQFFVAQDAVRGAFADGQFKQVHEAAGAEAGGLLPGRDDFGRKGGRGAFGGVVGAAGVVGEGVVAGLPTAQPQAHGGARTRVAARRGADAVGLRGADQCVAQAEFVVAVGAHRAIESEAGVGLSLHTSASLGGAPGSHSFSPGKGGAGQAPSGLPSASFTCWFTPFTPRLASTRIEISFCFRLGGSGCL